MSRIEAQKRADRIRSFREELRLLETEGVLILPDEQRAGLRRHHDSILQEMERRFDIDATEEQKQLSWGMRIASFLGALALCAGVVLFFYRYWGLLSTASQVGIVTTAPLLALAATEVAARRERTLYFAGILGLIAFGCFVLDLTVLGSVFNIVPSPGAFLPWAAFGFLLAYAYGPRILLVAGILSLAGYLAAQTGVWSGLYWLSFGERPENFFVPALVLLAIPLLPHRDFHDFPPLYRIFGLLGLFLPILVLANWGESSYLLVPNGTIEPLYQVAGFATAGTVIWMGIRFRHREVVNTGAVFFVIYLYTKFYDWWWDWMPKYLFFLILGGVAVGLLLLLKRLRHPGGGMRTQQHVDSGEERP
jgi:uncharacterized membrane protein